MLKELAPRCYKTLRRLRKGGGRPALLFSSLAIRAAVRLGLWGWKQTYEGVDADDLPWYSPVPDADLFSAINRSASKPGLALDLGSGPGVNAIALASLGWSVTGIDIAPGAIKLAKGFAKEAKVQVDFVLADVTRFRPRPNSLDLVYDRCCLHNLRQEAWSHWVEVVAESLKRGGVLIAKEHAFDRSRHRGPRGFTESELRNLVQARLEIESITKSRTRMHVALLLVARKVP